MHWLEIIFTAVILSFVALVIYMIYMLLRWNNETPPTIRNKNVGNVEGKDFKSFTDHTEILSFTEKLSNDNQMGQHVENFLNEQKNYISKDR